MSRGACIAAPPVAPIWETIARNVPSSCLRHEGSRVRSIRMTSLQGASPAAHVTFSCNCEGTVHVVPELAKP